MSDTERSGTVHFDDPAAALAALGALVLKERVMLGGLAAPNQAAALGLAWGALPEGATMREPEVNAALKRCLAEACGFLDVDHVELRRWLVDAGWLTRDGFGRQYHRVDAADLPAEQATIATAVSSIDPPRWAADICAAAAAERSARRQAWEARQAALPGGPAQPRQDGARAKGQA